MLDEDTEAGYRAKIILLKDKGYTVPEIRRATNHHMILTWENRYIVLMRRVRWNSLKDTRAQTSQSNTNNDIEKRLLK
jgi:hypothetical protein